ncbi:MULTISPECIES: phosphate/phosphite/phosphonate ABC transporter substrate-binding protein [unclassified Nostoc]|uniref:substrate-binding domain-containing protein n=1 Tax=unclassified Nostoc TaxID=2593658 RepID=UPI001F5597C0|nr:MULTISPECIES: phosphate/phosphite/phosphonate ABC transporter substrate-binding protein [unclassified Nostoc]
MSNFPLKLLPVWRPHRLLRCSIGLGLLFCISAIATSCTIVDSQNSRQVGTTSATSAEVTQRLRVVVIPAQSQEEQEKKLQPLAEYLEKTLKMPVNFQITKDYDTAVELLAKEDADMAYLGALTYIQARNRNSHIQPLVIPINESSGRPWYNSVIIANTAKGIKSLKDLKGKRFAFVSPSSTSGFLLPMSALQSQGIDPTRDFTKIRYAGSHDKVEQELTNDLVDAIANDKAAFLRSQKLGKLTASKYKIIWESDPIPSPPIVINDKKLSQKLIKQLQQALIDAPVGTLDITGTQSAGYTLAKDADFEQVRQIYTRLQSVKVAEK